MSPARDSSPSGSALSRFFNRGQWTILLALYAAVVFAGLVSVDYRNTSPGPSLAAWVVTWVRMYAFHIGLLCGLVAVVALVSLRLGRMFCSLPLLLFCLQQELGDYREKVIPPVAGETVTVMTCCLGWGGPADNAAAVLDEVQRADPDVLLLQRFTKGWSDALHAALLQKYSHSRPLPRDDYLGTAIYSRRAFEPEPEASKVVSLGHQQVEQVRAVIRIDGQRVAVYCMRLFPMHLNDRTTHRLQFADLKQRLERETLPAIVAGDLSFTRRTHQGNDLRDLGYEDAHQWVGKGRGGTWPANHKASWLPLMQLDHIYLSRGLACAECRTGQSAGSDHLPVIARIGLSTTSAPQSEEQGEPGSDLKTPAVEPTDLPKTSPPTAVLPSTGTGADVPGKTLPGGRGTASSVAPGSALPGGGQWKTKEPATTSSSRHAAEVVEPLIARVPPAADEPPPPRDPATDAADALPPRWEPWSRETEPPRRPPTAPDDPPLRAPAGSR